jgi:hypothetical protein
MEPCKPCNCWCSTGLFANDNYKQKVLESGEILFRIYCQLYTIGLAIELNPFKILEYKIEQGFKDRDTLYKQGAKLKGKHAELMSKLSDKEKELQLNVQKVKILQAENKGSKAS